MIYYAKSLKLGFLGDSHGRTDKIDEIRAKHPDTKEWFHNGDLLCFRKPEKNPAAIEWFKKHKKDYTFVWGNHEQVCLKTHSNISLGDKEEYARELNKFIKIILPDNQHLLVYHSKADSLWDFVEKNFSEREFLDDYPLEENTQAVVISHNHQQFKLVYPYTETEIWSIGAACFGKYAIYNNGKIEFLKL